MKKHRTVVLSEEDNVRKIVVIFEDGIVDIWRKAYGDDESIDMVRLNKEEFEKLKESYEFSETFLGMKQWKDM